MVATISILLARLLQEQWEETLRDALEKAEKARKAAVEQEQKTARIAQAKLQQQFNEEKVTFPVYSRPECAWRDRASDSHRELCHYLSNRQRVDSTFGCDSRPAVLVQVVWEIREKKLGQALITSQEETQSVRMAMRQAIEVRTDHSLHYSFLHKGPHSRKAGVSW
jgi:hypothetical protein